MVSDIHYIIPWACIKGHRNNDKPTGWTVVGGIHQKVMAEDL